MNFLQPGLGIHRAGLCCTFPLFFAEFPRISLAFGRLLGDSGFETVVKTLTAAPTPFWHPRSGGLLLFFFFFFDIIGLHHPKNPTSLTGGLRRFFSFSWPVLPQMSLFFLWACFMIFVLPLSRIPLLTLFAPSRFPPFLSIIPEFFRRSKTNIKEFFLRFVVGGFEVRPLPFFYVAAHPPFSLLDGWSLATLALLFPRLFLLQIPETVSPPLVS